MKFTPYSQGRLTKTLLGKPKASLTLFGTEMGGIFFPFFLFRLDFVASNCQINTFETFLGWKLTSIGIFWLSVQPIETYNSCSKVAIKMRIFLLSKVMPIRVTRKNLVKPSSWLQHYGTSGELAGLTFSNVPDSYNLTKRDCNVTEVQC